MRKKLSGWARIFIVLSVVYAVFIALMSFSFITTREKIKNEWLESIVDFSAKQITSGQEHRIYHYKDEMRDLLLAAHGSRDGVLRSAQEVSHSDSVNDFIPLLFNEQDLFRMLIKADNEGDKQVAKNIASSIKIGRVSKIKGFSDDSGAANENQIHHEGPELIKLSALLFQAMSMEKESNLSNYNSTLLKEILTLVAVWAIPLLLIALLFTTAKWVYRGFAPAAAMK